DYLDVARSCADWSVLEGRATTDVFADHLADEDAVARRLAPYDIVVAERERTPFRRSLIERLPRLRLLVTPGPVNWSIDYAAASANLVSKEELLRRADVVTIHVVRGPRTRGLIGARELALMKPTAYLVNTSRGPIVDERALIEALEGGRLAGAGLDVFDVEPLPLDHPFRRIETVVATPHVGYITAEQYRLFYGQAVEGIRAFLDGRPLRPLGP